MGFDSGGKSDEIRPTHPERCCRVLKKTEKMEEKAEEHSESISRPSLPNMVKALPTWTWLCLWRFVVAPWGSCTGAHCSGLGLTHNEAEEGEKQQEVSVHLDPDVLWGAKL